MGKKRKLLYSLSKKDFKMEFFRSGGKGGQHQNKTSSGVRIKHPASGAVGECRETRSQHRNKKIAFERLIKTPEFQRWHKIQCAKALGCAIDTEKWLEEQMKPENLRIEIRKDGRWSEIKPEDIQYEDLTG
ncbi:MAG: peptide chain release factor-like protein [Thermoanaerobacteraceae bacterium]|nr:peptide chain release factor-like protein [Thermoanaerobacteraceae bacterium]